MTTLFRARVLGSSALPLLLVISAGAAAQTSDNFETVMISTG